LLLYILGQGMHLVIIDHQELPLQQPRVLLLQHHHVLHEVRV
jgi:hypothetical protein